MGSQKNIFKKKEIISFGKYVFAVSILCVCVFLLEMSDN